MSGKFGVLVVGGEEHAVRTLAVSDGVAAGVGEAAGGAQLAGRIVVCSDGEVVAHEGSCLALGSGEGIVAAYLFGVAFVDGGGDCAVAGWAGVALVAVCSFELAVVFGSGAADTGSTDQPRSENTESSFPSTGASTKSATASL